jgi:hypothetical protein
VTAVDGGGSMFRCVVSFSRKKTASSLAFVSSDATMTSEEQAIIAPAVDGRNRKDLQWMQPFILILVGSSVFVLIVIVTVVCMVNKVHRCHRTSELYKPMQSVSSINADSVKLSVASLSKVLPFMVILEPGCYEKLRRSADCMQEPPVLCERFNWQSCRQNEALITDSRAELLDIVCHPTYNNVACNYFKDSLILLA